jgi:hypothetical protein
MYAGGGGGLLYDPVSTWIKFEECTLNLGRATSVEDNNTDSNEENSMDDSQDLDQGTNRHNYRFLNNMYHYQSH